MIDLIEKLLKHKRNKKRPRGCFFLFNTGPPGHHCPRNAATVTTQQHRKLAGDGPAMEGWGEYNFCF
ncbi:hypothetical protein BC343_00070 [Mucilaginibacter pedocola]|uniref:Uncharacterized protein n=1 Tax=Mucilaginibacter pedocola TaxID=1792845 RepID=A0A1S9PKM1_9SPHI|nr:hypothetical protein BC343_00070 [Mucilaginibacter pedocola]